MRVQSHTKLACKAGQKLVFTLSLLAAILATGCAGKTGAITSSSPTTIASSHSVDLSWNPSPSSVVGYNVYRGSVSGGPYARITGNPLNNLTFTDSAITSGQTYFYVVTALDSNSVESGFSNEAMAAIP